MNRYNNWQMGSQKKLKIVAALPKNLGSVLEPDFGPTPNYLYQHL